jgi:hypothetical protein
MMMLQGELGITWGAVWFGDLPDSCAYEAKGYKEKTLHGFSPLTLEERAVCLQLLMGRPSFGILGVRFVPDTSNQLVIKVSVNDEYDENLRSYNGLPSDVAEIVCKMATKVAAEVSYLGSGSLNFTHAHWDHIDSNQAFFAMLARTVILLLDPALDGASKEAVIEIIKDSMLH